MDTMQLINIAEFALKLSGLVPMGTPSVSTFANLSDQVLAIMPLLGEICNNFLGIFSDVIRVVNILDFLPTSWIIIISATVGTIVVLRIYSFFKDVEIAGFKI